MVKQSQLLFLTYDLLTGQVLVIFNKQLILILSTLFYIPNMQCIAYIDFEIIRIHFTSMRIDKYVQYTLQHDRFLHNRNTNIFKYSLG